MKSVLQIIFALVFLTFTSSAQSYSLAWSDEFNGNTIDATIWNHETGSNGWGNNELQNYTTSADNSYLQDGKLFIVARSGTNGYTSARLTTQGKQVFKYGRMEARIKLPYGQGIWPAFWMLGESIAFVGWPKCGEIDIMEMIGGTNNDNRIYGTAHWDNNGTKASYGGNKALSSGIFADDFHIFALEWTETSLIWYLDGNQYHSMNITPAELSEFHDEFFFILNVAVGGNWPGDPDATTIFPQVMEVDFVRVYQKTTAIEEVSEIVESPSSLSAYPNPFNSATRIVVNSQKQITNAKLYVFNMLGQLVEQNQISLQRGQNSFNWRPNENLNSGFYYFQIISGSEQFSQKLLYLK